MTDQRHIGRIVHSATLRLTLTYLAIIMIMSIGFSVVFYNTSSRQLDRQDVPQEIVRLYRAFDEETAQPKNSLQNFLHARAEEGRHELLARLAWLNVMTLIAGGGISYVLARRTLRPIEEAMEAQSRFVSDASHELRTPLTALQTTNEVALRKSKLTIAEARELIGYNIEEVAKLKSLSDGLLGLLKQDGQLGELMSVSLQAVVAEAMNRIAPAALAKDMSVHDAVANIMVKSNETALVQIVTILLDNAVKYSSEKSDVYIEAKARGKHVFLTVRDAGVGIKASDLPHIFDRFYRADSSRSKQTTEGYGLGLSIAHKLSDQLGVSISAKSQPGKGSTFTLKIPLA